MSDQMTLMRTPAGMRFIALATIYNGGDMKRLRAYLTDNFHTSLLEAYPMGHWMAIFRQTRNTLGKIRVQQVVATDEHHIVLIVTSEQNKLLLIDLSVDSEHPHKITEYTQGEMS